MRIRLTGLVFSGSVALGACGDTGRRDSAPIEEQASAAPDSPAATAPVGDQATATLLDAAGNELGMLTLAQSGESITVSGRLTGLPPGEHAIHVHTVGLCEPPKFESAGGHWNPTKRQHGKDSPQGPHQGDLPNFTTAHDRSVTVKATTAGGTLNGTNALLDIDGAAVVVHAKPDDYKTQPSGNAGDRIACGVVNGG